MGDQKTILVAEDDSFLRETMQLALQEHDVRVITAQNGQEAISMIDAALPDLLLLDLLMPVADGFSVLEHMKQKSYNVPTVILSNVSDDMNLDKCIEMGIRDFFVKSDMDEDELWERVCVHLDT